MDVRGNRSPEDVPGEQSFKARLPDWARERESGRWYGPAPADQSSQRARPKAPTKLIVVVPDEGGDGWAKARVLDNPGEAAALVEKLMADGLAAERLSVFSAVQMVVDVARRPVVQLEKRRKQRKPRG